MNSLQLSDWSSKPPLVLDQHHSYTKTNNNAWAEEDVSSSDLTMSTFQWLPVIHGIVIGVLFGGITLATVLTFWLTTAAEPSLNSTTTTSTTSSTSSTTTTTTTTSIITVCSTTGLGTLLHQSGVHPWTQYSYTYTATTTMPFLSFAFGNGGGSYTYLDDVSVVDNSAPSIELLDNSSFENSTSIPPIGWVTWCSSMCSGSGSSVSILNNSTCYSFPGNCYGNHCYSGPDFLAQSFSATIGNSYTISFWLQQTGGGLANVYVDVN